MARYGTFGGRVTAAALIAALTLAAAEAAADELKVAIVTFLSGPAAAHFGVPAQQGAQITIDAVNAGALPAPFDGAGMAGLTVVPTFIDEAGGATKQVAEFRNLVQRRDVDVVLGYVSSGDCLAVPQTAEEMKQLTVLVDCGTPRVFEEASYHYVFRVGPHAVMDNVAAARYLVQHYPDIKTVAGINQNYAWGQDSWNDFIASLRVLKPDIEVVDAQFPRLFAGQFGAEISALLAKHPDVIHTSLWGADLEALIVQGAGRGLFDRSHMVLSVGEHVLPRMGLQVPEGVIIGARGRHGDFAPDNALNRWFRPAYMARFGAPPNHPAYKFSMAMLGLKAAYDKAARAAGGRPDAEQVIAAFEHLEWDSASGPVKMALADGHQAIQANAIGVSKHDPESGRTVLVDTTVYPAECVNPPPGTTGLAWIEAGFPGNNCE